MRRVSLTRWICSVSLSDILATRFIFRRIKGIPWAPQGRRTTILTENME